MDDDFNCGFTYGLLAMFLVVVFFLILAAILSSCDKKDSTVVESTEISKIYKPTIETTQISNNEIQVIIKSTQPIEFDNFKFELTPAEENSNED